MVNNVYLINDQVDSVSKKMPSALFQLSKPLGVRVEAESKSNPAGLAEFTFLEPFEPYHLSKSAGGKVFSKFSIRSQPYSLNKPKTVPTNQNEQPINNNNNKILSRLSSISNSFKSIFVRPKHSKPVDLESFNNQKSKAESKLEETKFKLSLFSVPSGENSKADSFDMNQKLERIISKNVMQEMSSRRFESAESSSSAASTKSTMSSMSSMSSLVSEQQQQQQQAHRRVSSMAHQHAAILSSASTLLLPTPQPKILTNLSNSTPVKHSSNASKWTCMVCLSKHKIDVRICAICGSSNQDQINAKPNTNFAKHKPESTSASTALKSINNTAGANLKTWTCQFCNFANDSLKIVCMNCRAAKQQQQQSSNEVSLQHQSVQTKRVRADVDFPKKSAGRQSAAKCGCDALNRSNEENEFEEEEASRKRAKHDAVCSKCKCHLDQDEQQAACWITPIKPDNFDKVIKKPNQPIQPTIQQQQEKQPEPTKTLNSLFKLSSVAKWTCDTCLAPNEEAKMSCACCQTARPGKVEKSLNFDQTDAAKPIEAAVTLKPASSKWTCASCLVPNEAANANCVCCGSAKEGVKETSPKTKFASLVAAADSLKPALAPNSGITFGMKTTNEPIKFGGVSLNIEATKNVGFTFGKSKPSEEEKPKQVEEESQVKKPVLFEATKLSFLDNKVSVEPVKPAFASTSDNSVIEVSTKPGFSFAPIAQSTTQLGVKQEPALTFETPSKSLFPTGEKSAPNENGLFKFGFTKTNETPQSKPNNPFEAEAINKDKPVLFGAGFASSKNPTVTSKPENSSMFASSSFNQPTANMFGSANSTNTQLVFGATSQPTTTTTTTTTFGSTNGPVFGQSSTSKPEPAKSFVFGSSSSNTTGNNPSTNMFGSSGQTNSSFIFGQSQTPAPSQSFMFADNQPRIEPELKPAGFNFNSSFNFGGNNAPIFAANTTPLKSQQQQQATSSTPFVFSGLSAQANGETPSLQQALTPSTTSSSRPIKKPTRRLKK